MRVLPLAEESGFPVGTIYAQIAAGKIEHVRCGGSIVVTAAAARRLLGMPEPCGQVAA